MLQCDEAGKTLLGMPENYREFSIYQWKRAVQTGGGFG